MTKLNAQRCKEREEYLAALRQKGEALKAAIDKYNRTMKKEFAAVQKALRALNDLVSDADSWRENVSWEIEDAIGGKSDQWRETGHGQEVMMWANLWQDELREALLDEPAEIGDETDCMAAADELERMRVAP